MRKTAIILFIIFAIFAKANAMNVNISKDKILVGADFKGEKIAIFGKKERNGKLAIILKSHKTHYKIYNKEKVFGIWQNSTPRIFNGIYSVYEVQIEDGIKMSRSDSFKDFEIGTANINFYSFSSPSEALKAAEYKQIFLRYKQKANNYSEKYNGILEYEDSDIFFSEIEIPPNVKPGQYLLEVFLLNNGEIIEFSVFTINVEYVGIVKQTREFATNHKIIYAVITIFSSIFLAFISFFIVRILFHNKK